MLRDRFKESVTKILSSHFIGNHIETWQHRLRVFRQNVRGWILNDDAWYRKIKKEILTKLDNIYKNVENFGLTALDRNKQK